MAPQSSVVVLDAGPVEPGQAITETDDPVDGEGTDEVARDHVGDGVGVGEPAKTAANPQQPIARFADVLRIDRRVVGWSIDVSAPA